jgi:hypothetical protein
MTLGKICRNICDAREEPIASAASTTPFASSSSPGRGGRSASVEQADDQDDQTKIPVTPLPVLESRESLFVEKLITSGAAAAGDKSP